MIRVRGDIECNGMWLENDEYIALNVCWSIPRIGVPLYLRVSGPGEGEAELKFDHGTGALLEVILINRPPRSASRPSIADNARILTNRVAVADLATWTTGDSARRATAPVFTHSDAMSWYSSGATSVLVFSGDQVVKVLRCGQVTLGITSGSELGYVEVNESA